PISSLSLHDALPISIIWSIVSPVVIIWIIAPALVWSIISPSLIGIVSPSLVSLIWIVSPASLVSLIWIVSPSLVSLIWIVSPASDRKSTRLNSSHVK